MPLADLLAVCPPPASPVDVPTAQQWREAEQALSLVFPSDYRALLERYGSGSFGEALAHGRFFDLAFTLSPGCSRYGGDLAVLPTMRELTEVIGELRDAFPDLVADPAWPAPGGLLYVGGTTTGHCIYFKTTGPPEQWTCEVCDRPCDNWFSWPGDLTSLLAALVSRQVPDWILEGTEGPLTFRDLDTLEAAPLA